VGKATRPAEFRHPKETIGVAQMATINSFVLDISLTGTNATVTIDYDIVWNSFDRAANQPYREFVNLVGDDGGEDDPLNGGVISPTSPFLPVIVRSNGQATSHRHFVRTIPASILDEDTGIIVDIDEIKARARLTPVQPATATGISNVKQILV
jgi:hypothetical protein